MPDLPDLWRASRWSGRLATLLRPPLDQEVDPQLYRSFIILHLVGPLFGLPICMGLLLLDGGSVLIAPVFTVGVCLFWLLPAIAKTGLERAALVSVQLLTFVSLFGGFFYGGVNSPFAIWLIVAALIGFLYAPGKGALCAVAMAAQGAAFLAADQVWPHSARLDQAQLGTLFLASSFAAALYVALIAAFYSRIKVEGSKLAQIAARYESTARHAHSAIRDLEQDEQNVSAYMAKASHELRTALDVVIGYAELLVEDTVAEEREADQRKLARITSASRDMLALVSNTDRLADAAPGSVPGHGSDVAGPPRQTVRAGAATGRPTRRRTPRRLWQALAASVVIVMLASTMMPMAANAVASILAAVLGMAAMAVIAAAHLKSTRGPGARIDALTGLPDRVAFRSEIERHLAPAAASEVGLLFADLDGFKEVNDGLGHDIGDKLLAQVAERFDGVRTPGIMIARLGGDEFGAAAFGPGADAAILHVAEAMVAALSDPIRTDEHQLMIGVSIGLAHGRAGQVSGQELLRRSDVAMYRAKRDKSMPVRVFDAEMDEALNFRRTMRQDLSDALAGDQLDLHLQPVVEARSGELASVEGLLRWTHPLLGPVSPAKFIALAEESGQIVAIDDWVLERALEQAKRLDAVPIAINVSPLQFRHPHFARKIVDRLEAHGVPPQLLRLEITEGVLVTHTRAAGRAIGELREAGIKIALDDFGTGYSSLSYLKDFGFDLLKIDRSFVAALDRGRQGAELFRTIVELGHCMSMSVIAEGVESAEQAAAVQLFGCDFIQGYHTGRPMTLDQLQAWIAARRASTAETMKMSRAGHTPGIAIAPGRAAA